MIEDNGNVPEVLFWVEKTLIKPYKFILNNGYKITNF